MEGDQIPRWHVDGAAVRQETTLGPAGSGLITQWVIPYIVDEGPAKGTTHEVRVTPADFTPHNVEQAIRVSLSAVHGVASLRHGNA